MRRWIIGLCPIELLPGGVDEAECSLAWLVEGMRGGHDLYFVRVTRRGPPGLSARLGYKALLAEEMRATATTYAHERRRVDAPHKDAQDEGVFFVQLGEQQVALLELGAVDMHELDDEIPLEALEAVAGQTKGGAPPR